MDKQYRAAARRHAEAAFVTRVAAACAALALSMWLLMPRCPNAHHAWHHATPAAPRNHSVKVDPEPHIPKVVHMHAVKYGLHHKFKPIQDSWRRNHPGWTIRFWTEAETAELVNQHFPWFAKTYESMEKPSRTARYMWLWVHGGVFVDAEVESQRPLGPLLRGCGAVVAMMSDDVTYPFNVPDVLLASVPHHKLWVEALKAYRATTGDGKRRLAWGVAGGPGGVGGGSAAVLKAAVARFVATAPPPPAPAPAASIGEEEEVEVEDDQDESDIIASLLGSSDDDDGSDEGDSDDEGGGSEARSSSNKKGGKPRKRAAPQDAADEGPRRPPRAPPSLPVPRLSTPAGVKAAADLPVVAVRVPGLCVVPPGAAFPFEGRGFAGPSLASREAERRIAAACSAGSPAFDRSDCREALGIPGEASYVIAYWRGMAPGRPAPPPGRLHLGPSKGRGSRREAGGGSWWRAALTLLAVAGLAALWWAFALRLAAAWRRRRRRQKVADGKAASRPGSGGGGSGSGGARGVGIGGSSAGGVEVRRRQRVVVGEDEGGYASDQEENHPPA